MAYYRKVEVDYLQPKEKFICQQCDKQDPELAKVAERRYKIRFKMLDGTENHFCIYCASAITNKHQSIFLKQARKLRLVKSS